MQCVCEKKYLKSNSLLLDTKKEITGYLSSVGLPTLRNDSLDSEGQKGWQQRPMLSGGKLD